MSGRARFSLAIAAIAVVAIVAVAAPKIDLPDLGGGNDDPAEPAAREGDSPGSERSDPRPEPSEPARPRVPELPENPDEVTGDEPYALTRTANFRRALAILDRRRVSEEGVFDGLRVAPGRIDTVIETATRRINLQVRPDMRIAFESAHDFPNRPDYREYGIGGRDVDPRAPARILRQVDRVREGDAARDVDYIVIRRDIIDFRVNVTAYLRTGPRPRIFTKEPGEPFRAIG